MNSPIPSLLLPLWQNEHSPENQVLFMWNVLHKHSFCKRQLRWWQVCIMSQDVHQASTHSSFFSRKWLGVFLLPPPTPLVGMPVHYRVTPKHLPVPIYTLEGIGGTVRVKCLAQEHNTMFPARAWIRTAWNRKEIQKSNNRLLTHTAYNF